MESFQIDVVRQKFQDLQRQPEQGRADRSGSAASNKLKVSGLIHWPAAKNRALSGDCLTDLVADDCLQSKLHRSGHCRIFLIDVSPECSQDQSGTCTSEECRMYSPCLRAEYQFMQAVRSHQCVFLRFHFSRTFQANFTGRFGKLQTGKNDN